eukprot:sb/3476976/
MNLTRELIPRPFRFFQDNADICEADIEQKLYRICLNRPDLTLSEFLYEAKFTDEERTAICYRIGVKVDYTYTRCDNFWKINGTDFAICAGAIIISIALWEPTNQNSLFRPRD